VVQKVTNVHQLKMIEDDRSEHTQWRNYRFEPGGGNLPGGAHWPIIRKK